MAPKTFHASLGRLLAEARPADLHVVVVRDGCAHCERAVAHLEAARARVAVVRAAAVPAATLAALQAAAGRVTFPVVFRGGRLVGGCDELLKAAAA